ncbi:SDR family NAD(P)-dependent oxidoreductase [Novosphingobium naphthalenivorans]|jgi:NAD(P)-dependent dehydrogenase (short-subunit alcohol dehydrogenase family)|uniref:SDR family NAD(P)-dependent oxidoreductase n=1 Tax=Novosphingobium naphthalenivorans TaxID=273168 RepID=UPI00082C2757|nr:SDR family NAD(P)-dependent oxidoreductase [Novosphingobium naphthalenivorans]
MRVADVLEARLSLSGKTAVVTGAASGIGLATARLLCQLGAQVALLDRNQEGLQAALEQIAGFAGRALSFEVDLSSTDSIEAVFADIVEQCGGIDILVNSAAMNVAGASVDYDLDTWQCVLNVNLTGLFLGCRLAARSMIERGVGGSIINVASVGGLSAGITGRGNANPSYRASKGGVVNLTRALAVEWAPQKIRVNAVAPGYVRTPMVARLTNDPAREAATAEKVPLGRFAEPEEIGWVIAFLAGEGASMVTGQTVPVDGGLLA